MSLQTIDDVRNALGQPTEQTTYAAKQLHRIPDVSCVVRETFILRRCQGKRVLEFGASGPMHDAIVKVASSVVGVDRADGPGVVGFDLDDVAQTALPTATCDLIVCGEVLEHLSNPGWFLTRLKRQYAGVPVVITVPNAGGAMLQSWLNRGVENVNIDHVAWYSYRTLLTLLSRHGFAVQTWHWYKGAPRVAEGLVMVTE